MGDSAATLPGIGWQSLALSFASLGVVCLVAWAALRFLAGRGAGKATGAIRVLARCPLEPRRSVYVVEVAGRCFLLGVGDGPMSLLAELDSQRLPRPPAARLPFGEVLARVLRRDPPSSPGAAKQASVTPVEELPAGRSGEPSATVPAERV
jgi:flagellar biosynthetic protein FliO